MHVIYLVEEFFAKGKPRVIEGHPDVTSGSACLVLTDSKLTKLQDPAILKIRRVISLRSQRQKHFGVVGQPSYRRRRIIFFSDSVFLLPRSIGPKGDGREAYIRFS